MIFPGPSSDLTELESLGVECQILGNFFNMVSFEIFRNEFCAQSTIVFCEQHVPIAFRFIKVNTGLMRICFLSPVVDFLCSWEVLCQ